MDINNTASITAQDIRKTIVEFLQQRLANNSAYKSESTKLAKAESENDSEAIAEAKQKISEIKQKFEFEHWMEDAATRRIFWISIATHVSKGIHSSSKGDNVNYLTQEKSKNSLFVSSATPNELMLDASGNAAALDIFALFNQQVKEGTTLLQLLMLDHPAIIDALSDDHNKAMLYFKNFKLAIDGNWDNPQSSELNKQLYWLNSENSYLSADEKQYRLLIPLHPSSLCHVVYQKVQERFSEKNKLAKEQRSKKTAEQQSYFSFHDLAVVGIGGSNPQGVSQLTSAQGGRNFLLPSIPPTYPQIATERSLKLTKQQTTIFNNSLKFYCYLGLLELYSVVEEHLNTVDVRNKRKQALGYILSQLLNIAEQIQTQFPAGWSKNYKLNINQKFWLDPKRAELEDEEEFSERYHDGAWIDELALQFAQWLNAILKAKFKGKAADFADAEIHEWQREFHSVVKASQRNKRGIF